MPPVEYQVEALFINFSVSSAEKGCSGPYCRVREGGGEDEGRYGAATTATLATATEGDSALGEIYGSVPARRGFEAANAALNVFNPLSTGVNVCVLSNGVLLERQ
jgi:hypothetical protein